MNLKYKKKFCYFCDSKKNTPLPNFSNLPNFTKPPIFLPRNHKADTRHI